MLNVRINVKAVEQLADRTDSLVSRAELTLAAIDAVNAVAVRADESIRRGENQDLSLTDAYVKSKTDVALATRKARAEILTRGDLTILGRYPITQQIQQAKGVRTAKGDAKRGIPAGQKQAGLRVAIKRSAPVYETKWFTMTLRRGTQPGEDVGVFVRTSKNSVKHIYGPSPYSLARYQINAQQKAIEADLEVEATARTTKRIEQVLK